MAAVTAAQRFSPTRLCPICGGHNRSREGERCWGFLSSDGEYAHCTRVEFAGTLDPGPDESYAHRLAGECRCGTQHGAQPFAPTEKLGGLHKATANLVLKRSIVKETVYRVGEFHHVRRDYSDGNKGLTWRRLDGSIGLGGTPLVDLPLYLPPFGPEALPGSVVVITEGEKSADSVATLGFAAVGTTTGAKSCPSAKSFSVLRGFDLVIWPDHDDDGAAHRDKIGATLQELGTTARVLLWPDAPHKGDAGDFYKQGHTPAELQALITAAQPWVEPPSMNGKVHRIEIAHAVDLMHMEIPEIRWAIPGVLPEGVALIAGKAKLGKSWLILDACLAVSRGLDAWGSVRCEQGDVLYLALEDSLRRLKSRLHILIGTQDPGHLDYATKWPRADEGGVEEIIVWLEAHPEARLVVIDTLKKFRPQEANTKRLYDTDYEAIAPIAEVAGSKGVSILVVHHTNKMNPDDPLDSVSGTTGLVGAADVIGIFRRERGKADASLLVTGRDVDEQEIAFKRMIEMNLRSTNPGHYWGMIGDAEEIRISEQRGAILDLLHANPGMRPAEISETLDSPRGTTRKLLFEMVHATPGQVRLRDGRYYAP